MICDTPSFSLFLCLPFLLPSLASPLPLLPSILSFSPARELARANSTLTGVSKAAAAAAKPHFWAPETDIGAVFALVRFWCFVFKLVMRLSLTTAPIRGELRLR